MRETVDVIYRRLTAAQFSFSVARIVVAGSFAKQTALNSKFDVVCVSSWQLLVTYILQKDLVVMINTEKNPVLFLDKRKKVIDEIDDCLDMMENIEGKENKAKHCITFKFRSVQFDLLLG